MTQHITPMSLELHVKDLGITTYAEAWKIQQQLFRQRQQGEIGDTLLLTEHPPTISLGIDNKWNVLHVPREEAEQQGLHVVNSHRGGGAAYLGPGQIIGYTIMDVSPYGGIHSFLKKLEEITIRTARTYGIHLERYDHMNPTTEKPYRAVWYMKENKKYVLCTKGIGVTLQERHIYTHHGFALHVNREEPSYFHFIDPCGFPQSEVTPIALSDILRRKLPMEEVKNTVASHYLEVFRRSS